MSIDKLKLVWMLALGIVAGVLVSWLTGMYEQQPAPLSTDQITLLKGHNDTVVIFPIFTQGAYEKHGFYDYYNKTCDVKCLTVPMPEKIIPNYNTGKFSYGYLKDLNYTIITDVDVDKDPSILGKYDKIILLHNEYVTHREFDAITAHHHVIYLHPNALYAEVNVNYTSDTITLIHGHGYPNVSDARNAFGWKFDNSANEYNVMCNNWHFTHISNGAQLDCYPDLQIRHDKKLLEIITHD